MKQPLQILHLEDSPQDIKLVQTMLETGGISFAATCVRTHDEFVAALETGGIDLVLADFLLPTFDGKSALKIVRARCPHLPFILVSGSLGEEVAIDALISGATDYVLKDRLARLVPAVRRAMQEVTERGERRLLEERFIQSQKMEVFGRLASGVAHDFNNILAVILGYSDLLVRTLRSEDSLMRPVEEIQRAAERATALTRQLLVFARKETLQAVVLDLNHVLAGMDKMLHQLINENISLVVAPDTKIARVKADPGLVGQVLMNLVVNARDAMPDGGKLIIETRDVVLDQNYTRTCPDVTPGDYVMLAVSDTGVGMTDEVKAHLFEAFFTTKPKGKGTGLGLATCHTIVKQCGGHINVYSELGKGTTFKVYFPRAESSPETTVTSDRKAPLPRGTETLLLVEDEPSVRHLAQGVLESQGYNVLRATNGQDALHVARSHKGKPIRLVVTDVIMPQMGGKVMAEWLKTLYPDLKILFTSGYTDDAIAHHGVLDPGVAFLPKPYTPATITRKVREMLDAVN